MQQKKFVANLFFLLFLNLLIKPFWILGIDRAFQNAVGSQEYGIYFALFNFSFLFNIFLDLGITNFNNKNIAQNNHLLSKHFSSILGLKLFLCIIYIIITLTIAFVIGYDTNQAKFLFVMAFNQFLISLILYMRSNLAGLHLFKTDSLISVLDRLIMIVICSLLLWGNFTSEKPKILWYAYAQTVAYLLTAFVAFIMVLDRAKIQKINFNIPFYVMILKKSLPYAILVLLMTFYNRIDTVMLERILKDEGAEQSGIYAQAYRLLDAANMIAYLFSVPLLPLFASMLKKKETIEQLATLSYKLLIAPAIVVAIGCLFYNKELMSLMYINHVDESSTVFGLLMLCFVAISTTYIFGTLLTANGNLRQLNIMATGGMVLNISLNIILIPEYKAIGAASASLITQSLTALIQVLMAASIFRFKINFKFIMQLAVFIILVILINYGSRQIYFQIKTWIFNFLIMSGLSGVMAFVTGIINVKSVLSFLKLNKIKK